METPSLEYFIEVARKLNISKAAASLNITQQSLSSYIQKLEQYYGEELLIRRPKMRLTEAGEYVYKAVVSVEEIHEELLARIHYLKSGGRDTLTLGVQTPLKTMVQLLPFEEFTSKFPKMSMKIEYGFNHELQAKLEDGSLDLFFLINSMGYAKKENPQIGYVTLVRDRKCVVIKDTLLDKILPGCDLSECKTGVSLKELAMVPVVLHPEATGITMRFKRFCRQQGYTPKIFAEVGDQGGVNAIVKNGIAMGLSSTKMAKIEFQEDPHIHIFPLSDEGFSLHNIELLYRRDPIIEKVVCEMKDWFYQMFENL